MENETTIFTVLKAEHQNVLKMLEMISERSLQGKPVEVLLNKVHRELELHSLAEEQVLYPKLMNHRNTEENADDALQDHMQIRIYLEKLDSFAYLNGEFHKTFENLRREVEHHIQEEEGEIFDRMKMIFSQEELIQLAEEFLPTKEGRLGHAA